MKLSRGGQKGKERNVRRSSESSRSRYVRTYADDLGSSAQSKASSKHRKKKLVKQIIVKSEILLAVLLMLIVARQMLYVSSDVAVYVHDEGTISAPRLKDIKSGLQVILEQKIANRVKPFIPREQIKTYLESKSYIATVNIGVTSGSSRVSIELFLEQPTFELTADGRKYDISQNGRVIGEHISTDELIVIKDSADTGGSVEIGHSVFSPQLATFIRDISAGLTEQGIAVDFIELTENTREVVVHLGGSPYVVKTYTGERADLQVVAVGEVLSYLKANSLPEPAEYIDVRLVSRAVYK